MTPLIPGIASDDPTFSPSLTFVFGGLPWVTPAPKVTGPGGYSATLNNQYYATLAAAEVVMAMIGGVSIITVDTYATNKFYKATTSQLFVTLPNGKMVNAGQVANLFAHGYPLGQLAQMLPEFLTVASVEIA